MEIDNSLDDIYAERRRNMSPKNYLDWRMENFSDKRRREIRSEIMKTFAQISKEIGGKPPSLTHGMVETFLSGKVSKDVIDSWKQEALRAKEEAKDVAPKPSFNTRPFRDVGNYNADIVSRAMEEKEGV